MSLRSLKQLRKKIGFRLTVWYSGIFILSSLFLFALAYFLLSSSLHKQDHEAVHLRLEELSVLYQTGGRELLEREVTVEKKFEKKIPFFIRLAGGDNETLFLHIPYQWVEFDIKQLEKMTPDSTMRWARLPGKNKRTVLEVASIRLSNDHLLQVGKSTEDREKILRHFREIFTAVMVPLIVFGFAGGAFLGFRALRPIRHLIGTVRSVGPNRMDARVPSPHTGDELDELATLFNGMLEKIEALIDGMRDSLDNVAHDLRTPVTRFRGTAEMALQSDQNLGICREALADCIEESDRILTMLNTLMGISEAETGVMKLELKSVNVSALIEGVAELYRYVAEDKGITVHSTSSKDLSLTADPNRVRQILANLLDNAIKYTPNGGRIDIEAHHRDKEIVVLVKDTGIGINPEELPRIWDRLYRCDQSRSQKGLGLGLSLIKAIVQAHKGHIEVFSEPGKGSTFTISLPSDDHLS
jgi:signal transduction histidine kinase